MRPGALAKRMARRLLAAGPAYSLLRAFAHRGDPVTILCYHTLGADDEVFDAWTVLRMTDFRAQIDVLRAAYDIVSLDEALEEPRPRGSRPRAVITFDDGDAGLHRHLLPFLEEERIPVTVYVATRQIETGRPYWFDTVMNALQGAGPFVIDLKAHGLPAWTIGPERGLARWSVISAVLETLKGMPEDRREDLAAEIVAQAPPSGEGFVPLAPMSLTELTELARSPWITIGSHSHGHELLDQVPEGTVRESAGRSRLLLEGWTGRRVHHFAYPNGNHDITAEAAIAGLGFRSAAALGMRVWRRDQGSPNPAERLRLPRVAIGRYDYLDRFCLRLLGI